MKNYEFRLLRAHEIEARPSRINKDGSVNLLLYKTSRVDMQLLDEAYGNCGWRISHEIVNGELWTRLEIRDPETGEWIVKEDVGEWSDNTLRKLKDEENPVPVDELYLVPNGSKARFSDGLKRCGTLVGIGRELYSAPFIYIPPNKVTVKYGQCYTKFEIEEIEYDEYKQIVYLKIVDEKTGEPLFVWRRRKKITKEAPAVKPQVAPKEAPKEAPKPEIKAEVKAEPKEEPKAEVKTESNAEVKAEVKEEAKPKRLKIAPKEKVDKLLELIDESGIGRGYLLEKYKAKFNVFTYYKFPELHVDKMLADFEGTVIAHFKEDCEKKVRAFCVKHDLTIEEIQQKANSKEWREIDLKLRDIENEILGIQDEIPFN